MSTSTILLKDSFNTRPDGLITNEYAYRHPNSSDADQDNIWEVTSGSLFAQHGKGYTGIPDSVSPSAESKNGNNSAVFRCRSRQTDFGDVTVEFSLYNIALYENTGVGPHSYDGVHVWLRYQSELLLYVLSINRRDNQVAIKKKIPGEPSNSGIYYTLAFDAYQVPYGTWQQVRATAQKNLDGSVTLALWVDSNLLLTAIDTGFLEGNLIGNPITQPGRVGMRGDNCEFYFDNFICRSNLAKAEMNNFYFSWIV